MEVHGNDLHVLHASCKAKQQCSHGADLLTLSEHHINKQLTGICVEWGSTNTGWHIDVHNVKTLHACEV